MVVSYECCPPPIFALQALQSEPPPFVYGRGLKFQSQGRAVWLPSLWFPLRSGASSGLGSQAEIGGGAFVHELRNGRGYGDLSITDLPGSIGCYRHKGFIACGLQWSLFFCLICGGCLVCEGSGSELRGSVTEGGKGKCYISCFVVLKR